MKILFLDDDETRHEFFEKWASEKGHEVHHRHDAQACVDKLEAQKWDAVFLDCDLGDIHEEGYVSGEHVANWLYLHPDRVPPLVVVHSWNTEGAARMMDSIWGNTNKDVHWCPFGPGIKRYL